MAPVGLEPTISCLLGKRLANLAIGPNCVRKFPFSYFCFYNMTETCFVCVFVLGYHGFVRCVLVEVCQFSEELSYCCCLSLGVRDCAQCCHHLESSMYVLLYGWH